MTRLGNRIVSLFAAACSVFAAAPEAGVRTGQLVAGTLGGRWCAPLGPLPAAFEVHTNADGRPAVLSVGDAIVLALNPGGEVERIGSSLQRPAAARWRSEGDVYTIEGTVGADCAFRDVVLRLGRDEGSLPSVLDERIAIERMLAGIDDAIARGLPATAGEIARGLPGRREGLAGIRDVVARARIAISVPDYDKAGELLSEAIARLGGAAGPRHPAMLHVRALEALLTGVRGELEDARALHEQVATDYAVLAAPDDPDRIENEIGLGVTLNGLGDAAAARAILLSAVDRARRVLGDVDPVAVRGTIGLALAGGLDSAEASRPLLDLYQKLESAWGEGTPTAAGVLLAYASASERAGSLYDAQAALDRAHAIRYRVLGPDHPRTIVVLEYLAFVRAELNRLDEAVQLQRQVYEQTKRLRGDLHPRTMLAEQNLGAWLLATGNAEEAQVRLANAHAALERQFGARHLRTLDALIDLADAAFAAGQTLDACERYAAASRRAREEGERLQEQGAKARYGEGRCALAQGRAADAANLFEEVWRSRVSTAGEASEHALAALASLARSRIAMGDHAGAISTLERVLKIGETLRGAEAPQPGGGRASFARRAAGDPERAGYRDLAWLYASSGRADDAIRVAELARGRALVDVLAAGTMAADPRLPARDRLLVGRLGQEMRQIDASLALLAIGTAAHSELLVQRESIASSLRQLRARVAADRGPDAALDARRTADALPGDTAILGVQSAPGGVWTYLLRARQPIRTRQVAASERLLERIRLLEFDLALARPGLGVVWELPNGRHEIGLTASDMGARRSSPARLAELITQDLLGPVEDSLRGVRRLIVVADGPLSRFPFEMLRSKGRPLASSLEIRYVPSLATLGHWQRRPSPDRRRRSAVLAIGAPSYKAMGRAGPGPLNGLAWTELPSATAEVRMVARQFGQARTRTIVGGSATKARLVALARDGSLARTRYLHVAAHAYLSTSTPQWSALVLGGDDDSGPGYLTAAEIATFELDADLVTLSACETGLGADVAGEGIFGLPFALVLAGARSTLLTLWPVADESTAAFMERFYAKLARGERPAAALAKTKREFMRHAKWSDPFFWAPFVLYGAG